MSKPKPNRAHGPAAEALLVAALLAPAACQQVEVQQVASWREAVGAAREQCAVTFQTLNALVRADQLARAPKLERLAESDFAAGLDGDSIARFLAAVDALTSYAGAVEKLLGPEIPKGVGASLQSTAEQVGATANVPLLKSDQALSKNLGELGQAIASASAQRSARAIMLETDAHVTDVLTRLADMLLVSIPAANATGGVYVTVKDAWDRKLAEIEVEFKTTKPEGKQAVVERYVRTLGQRDLALQSIRSLRASMLDLAASHTAAAQGRAVDVQAVITAIREQILVIKAVASELKKPAA
jgi:hypothetical protein